MPKGTSIVMALSDHLKNQLATLPALPGIYMFKNETDEILYVGKAKALRTRVRSYFRAGTVLDPAKVSMVSQIASVDTIVCHTEIEALILEANLIRQHKPPYNVVLTDDKYYLFIKVTKGTPPRVYPVRRLLQDGARYFGPYSSARAVRQTLRLLRRLFPHLDEKDRAHEWVFPHPLFTESAAGPQRQSGLRQANETYAANIRSVIQFLQGQREPVMARLRDGMQAAAKQHEYERAQIFRDQLQNLERLEGSQKVYLPQRESFDVISVATDNTRSAVSVLQLRQGKLLNQHTFLLKHRVATQPTDILRQFMLQYYAEAQDIPPRIYVPLPFTDTAALAKWIHKEHSPQIAVPQRGKRRQLLQMGELNARHFLTTQLAELHTTIRLKQATGELARALQLPVETLHRIETYDVSNIQGTLGTGSMVVFIDGTIDRKQYRTFRIRLQATPNDVAMVREILQRRFSGQHPDWPIPDLVLVDGGKPQLTAARTALTAADVNVPLAALAKREEELFTYPPREHGKLAARPQEIRLPYDSDALYLIQRMRDEAHRVTVSYHRLLRSKRSSRSLLDEIPGIGPATKRRLLNHFGSLKAIRAATKKELIQMIGRSKTDTLRQYL